MIKLLVADHHPIIRKGLELLFLTSPVIKVEGGVDDGESIFDFLKSNTVDILISEIDLPKLNGITALRRLKKEYPNLKVLMFSTHPEEVYAMSSIKAGASGYISKTANILTLREAILKIDQGGIYLSNDLTHRLAFGERVHRTGSFYKKLSTREVEVLKLLSIGKKNKEIAKELDINEKTVSTYKARLMKKLQASNLVELLNQAKLLES
ncbi:response regulator [Formosa algae]|uniref:DNA-binding NarL/FixJ family response regulator n=1 Tax=Formosa algae TaxID=225843 RepID=A0A9X0YH12_9FLAO|nr:response regulator transcription factor [Formosa algae]MBP1838222.1 DNA-binding NarL/FixJ family response regulator [Formosa algae]MDQ0334357.1 DNA-binding NarL/FixJ family response regulator [Formosa algae]OEI80697.1 DNA-binding response regulator [Formosa algae]PNW29921.1 DNA-binding response regulator [Formosa algae]